MSNNIKHYLVKDSDGDRIIVESDNWECSGNGLKFYLNGEVVAWFCGWQHFRVIA